MRKYTNTNIGDLIILISESDWALNVNKGFYYEFEKGGRFLFLSKEENDWELQCRDKMMNTENMLVLPSLFSIPPAVLYGVLQAYGIVSMLALATAEGLTEMEGHTA